MPWVTKQQANTNRRGGWTTVKQKIPLQKNENYQNAVANAQKYAQEAQQANSWKGMLGNMLKASPKAAADVLIGTPFKFGASVAEIPGIVKRRGQTTQREYKIPGLSPFKSYQSDFQNVANDVLSGKRGMGSAAWSVAQPVLGGLEMFGIGKGIGRGVKAFRGAPTLSQGIRKAAPEVLDAFVPTTRGINTRVSNRSMAAQLQDPLIQEARKGEYLYHGTNETVLDSISKEGLKPGRRGALSLSKDETYAKNFAREGMTPQGKTNSVLLRVKSGALKGKTISGGKNRPMSDQLNEILTNKTIPPENLEIYKNGKWQPLQSQPLQEGVNPLIQEARKGDVYYHASKGNIAEFKDTGKPIYFSKDKSFGENYLGKGAVNNEVKLNLKKTATLDDKKVGDILKNSYFADQKNRYPNLQSLIDDFNMSDNDLRDYVFNELKAKGYDSAVIKNDWNGGRGYMESTVVFNPKSIKSQSLQESSLIQEARKVELNTGPKQGINKFYPSFLRSGQRTLENQGSTGQVLANTLEDERVAEDLQIGKWKAFVNQFTGQLNDAQKANLTDVLEGKSSPMDSTVAGSSKALRNWLNKVQRTAGEKGLDVGYRENYFPRKYNWSEITKEGRKNEITQHLVDTGQASTRAEAEDFLNDFIFKNSQRKAGNLEYERMFDIPGYERDPEKALTMYAESAGKRLTQVEHFGAKDEVVNSLINKIDKEGGDYKSAQKIFDYVYKGEDKNKFADALLAYNTFTKLSLAFFSNLTQSANTAAKGGIINTIKGAAQALAQGIKAMKGQKYDDIAILSNSLDEYIGLQESGLSGRFVKGAMYLFQKVENFNRRTAANTGVLRANQLAKVLSKDPQNATAIRQLESLGIKLDDIVKGKLTEQQLLTAANKMTKTTQFKMNALMMPQAWRTPMGKVLTQFKGFSFMQTKFLRDEVIKEAAKGNLAPLTRFLMIAPIASYVTQSARNYINQAKTQADFRKGDLYRKAVGDLPSDIASQMQYANEKKDKWYTTPLVNVKNFSSPFIGPTGSDVLQVASALEQKGNIQDKNETWYKNHPAAQQDPNLDLKRFAVTKIPFIGRRLANTTFGYGPTVAQNAKELARQAIQNNDQNLFNQALEKDPYLKKEDALRAAIGKKVSEMTPTEKKFYEQVKAEARKSKPYYSK